MLSSDFDAGLVSQLLGHRVESAEPILERGYTPNRRWLVRLKNGQSVFVKQACDELTARWLRSEYAAYQGMAGRFLPEMLGWADQNDWPLLVLEDLSEGTWPPPWPTTSVDAVLHALDELWRQPPYAGLGGIGSSQYAELGWPAIAEDPQPFLSLGLCSAEWLDKSLPILLAAAQLELLDGNAVLHLDVRSDNICLFQHRAVLIDWNHAALGNPEFDLAFWLPSLRAEGGPEPESVADISPGIVALVAGFFASRAGLSPIPDAPGVRAIQRVQLETALPWAVRVLDLPPLDGGRNLAP